MPMQGDFLDLLGRLTIRRHRAPTAGSATGREMMPDDRLRTIVFECLAEGIGDDRVDSLMHVIGWTGDDVCMAVAGRPVGDRRAFESHLEARLLNAGARSVLTGFRDGWTVMLIGAADADAAENACMQASAEFGTDDFVCLGDVGASARGAASSVSGVMSALKAAPGVPDLPHVIHASDVLPERALLGDATARRQLYEAVYQTLRRGGPCASALPTVDAFLSSGGSLDATAKKLRVHPNTVRYRLRRVASTTGWDATDPREAYVLRTALAIGRIDDAKRQ